MELLTPKEIEDLRSKEEEMRIQTRIAQQKKEWERKLEARKRQLEQRIKKYEDTLYKEIKELQISRDLLLNEVTQLREEKRRGKQYVNELLTDAQNIRIEAHKRLTEASNVEKYVDGKIDKLERFRRKYLSDK